MLRDPHAPSGLSVVCQRQLLRGTQRKSRRSFLEEVERLGTEFNLITLSYAVGVGGLTLTRHFSQVMDLLYEALIEPAFNLDELKHTQRTYAAELESQWDEDGYLAWLWLLRRLYQRHPLWTKVSVTSKGVLNLSAQQIIEHWSTLHSQEGFLPSLSGSVSPERSTQAIDHLKSALPTSPLPLVESSALLPSLPPLKNSQLTCVHKSDRAQVQILMAQPGLSPHHPDARALKLAIIALGGTFSSPLTQEVRVKRGLSYGASAFVRDEGSCSIITLNATPNAQDVFETAQVMRSVFHRISQGGLTDQEVYFARDHLINAHPFRIETPAMRASMIARATLQGIDPNHLINAPDFYEQITPDQVRQAAQTYLNVQCMEVIILGDREVIEPQVTRLGQTWSKIKWIDAQDPPESILDEQSPIGF